jgi:hypothetical protein
MACSDAKTPANNWVNHKSVVNSSTYTVTSSVSECACDKSPTERGMVDCNLTENWANTPSCKTTGQKPGEFKYPWVCNVDASITLKRKD